MTDDTQPCTRAGAMRLLGEIEVHGVDQARYPELDVAAIVARLQTLSDADLATLSLSRDTFSLNESNRRLAVALRQEAARTTQVTEAVLGLSRRLVWLTWLLAALTVALRVIEGVRDEKRSPDKNARVPFGMHQ